MTTYKLHNGTHQSFIIDIERNAFIPFDPANTDYQAYLQWIEAGNQPEPADE
jgi:hypothetical protein